jgi:hypothetical protein
MASTEKEKNASGTCRETEGHGPAWEGVDDPSPPERLKKIDQKPPSSSKRKFTGNMMGYGSGLNHPCRPINRVMVSKVVVEEGEL